MGRASKPFRPLALMKSSGSDVQRPKGRLLTGGVAVVADPHLRRVSLHQPRLLLGEGRAQRGHHALHAVLAKGHGVHVALHQHQPPHRTLLRGEVQRVEAHALVEHRRLRRVQVLGLGVAHGPPAKAQHPALGVDDGKHHPPAEHVEKLVLPADHQTRLLQEARLVALLLQMMQKAVPAFGRSSEAEAADVRIVEAAPVEVVQGVRALVCPQQSVEEFGGGTIRFIHLLPFVAADANLPRLGASLRKLHVGALRQEPHRVHELHPLQIHHKVDDRAALMAAKAVVELGFGVHGEGRRLLVVERATAPETAALLLEGDVFGDHFLQADAASQLLQPGVRQSSAHVILPFFFLYVALVSAAVTVHVLFAGCGVFPASILQIPQEIHGCAETRRRD